MISVANYVPKHKKMSQSKTTGIILIAKTDTDYLQVTMIIRNKMRTNSV